MPYIDSPPPAIEIVDGVHSQPSPIKIIHVGAGASGLLFAYKARKMLQNYELICYEKNGEVGGTWLENTYPGCACDIPAHVYTYSFEPNPNWSAYYSGAPEIQEYFVRFYKKYDLESFMKFNHKVISATWDDKLGHYDVELLHQGEIVHDWCHVLVNGSGVVNQWKWPAIAGLNEFKGKLVHSAAWDPSVGHKGKKVAVIGTGSSSIQMVPKLADGADQLTVFMRSNTWIAPSMTVQEQKIDDSDRTVTFGRDRYSQEEIANFNKDPEWHLKYRKELEGLTGKMFPLFLRGTPANVAATENWRADMLRRIGVGSEELKEKLIPKWSPGCRRLTPGIAYLETLTLPHVSTVHEEIIKVTSNSLVTAGGRNIEVDIIACGTGFDIAYVPHFKIFGRNGVEMQEDWSEPNIYCSIAGPGYPNYWVINGPRGNWGQGCALPSHEVQIEYVIQCIEKMQQGGIKSMEVKQKPTTDFNNFADAWHAKYSVWAEDCKSWYKNNKTNGRVYLWPGTLLHHLKTLRKPLYEHYEFEYEDNDNVWAFLGNGFTKNDELGTTESLTPFIRNADTAWDL
ncbi:hypothetical protein FB567DRAFT_493912 [Paraphoma chrysanthemicola]|uniref:Uncharacterized protein n=1 Tax=Paraphoma chrysanthemicola TaxID=798071 RepID=A0A8K0VZM9_9PLEO|nr:hypothetical protein FB567DRAFT_493912 [Paraphoma chrysanthemicola]